jgi:uncharacterized protein (TIGR00369 family)
MQPDPTMDRVPAGFEPMKPYGPFCELVGPIYEREGSDGTVLGLRVQDKHRNRMPSLHGGMICTLVDTAMAHAVRRALEARLGSGTEFTLVTVQMSISFIGNAVPGQWVEAQVDVLRAGRRMGFTACNVSAGTGQIVQASAQFMVLPGAPNKE